MRRGAILVALTLAGCGQTGDVVETRNRTAMASPAAPPPPVPAPRIVPIPPIPVALRGCWTMDDPDLRDDRSVLEISATAITERASWRPQPLVATPEFVQAVSDTGIEGRFSAPEGEGRMTLATTLSLGPNNRDTPPGKLVLVEGDAGSRWYRRCNTRPQDKK